MTEAGIYVTAGIPFIVASACPDQLKLTGQVVQRPQQQADQIGRFFTFCSVLKMTEVAHIFCRLFSTVKDMH
jgi:hypothetical protein